MLDIFIARQPIFDAHDRLFGYELLYRKNATQNFAADATPEQMSSDVIVHSIIDIGLEQITTGHTGFLNFSREMLVSGVYELLDPNSVMIELLETVEPDDEVVRACTRLHAAGYRLALDDFVYDPRYDPMIELAQIAKIDVLNRSVAEIAQAVEPLRRSGIHLLAERVEKAQVREDCLALGFDLFQGYHFSRPEILSKREISLEQMSIIRLMNTLRDENASDTLLEEAFRSDLTLSYKLLRIVNSAGVGGRGVQSIQHAIRLIGRAALHRWLALLLVSSIAREHGVDAEIVHTAICRARPGWCWRAYGARHSPGPPRAPSSSNRPCRTESHPCDPRLRSGS
ncbi:MAG: EAL domain-containing protein [Gemmatimonadetes bacterium]|nr:EAL domain-containing protein [Gemmatimonadota bacterium]